MFKILLHIYCFLGLLIVCIFELQRTLVLITNSCLGVGLLGLANADRVLILSSIYDAI